MRNLAYSNSPGQSWPEESWVRARMWTQGLSKEAAESEIAADIDAKKLIVVEKAK